MPSTRILLVTAIPETGVRIADMLGPDDHVVDAVTDGAEAFQRVWEAEYDAIVAELGMPGVDGRDLYMALQNTWPEITRRMIVFAAEPTPTQERFASHTGVLLLRGPLGPAELRAAIGTLRGLPRVTAIA
jgi:CheY-like chemotaxis protein